MDVCIFFFLTATSYGWWRTSPFEPLKDGFATGTTGTTGATTERREWREQTPPFFLVEGEARRRGGGTIYATDNPPPKYAYLEGWAALGGVSTMSYPRGLNTYGYVTFCRGWGAGVFVPFYSNLRKETASTVL